MGESDLDPRTEYAKQNGFTIHPDQAEKQFFTTLRTMRGFIDKIERDARLGVLDTSEITMLQSSIESLAETALCAEWDRVYDSIEVIVNYVKADRGKCG
ncbi:hypothetical protein [Chroococcidiopsis sp.]|uniref:hypothetical protein n=1 Tax=Chroococcidiopsis sp. TaxID=3088168 RepID=UPI003F390831